MRYLTKRDVFNDVHVEPARQIDDLVTLRASCDADVLEVTLVAHSLGSAIALDFLNDPHSRIAYRRFVMLRSPLGLIGSVPERLSESMLPESLRQLTCPWREFAVEKDSLATARRVGSRQGFAANPFLVTTLSGSFENPHESCFLNSTVAREWTALCEIPRLAG